MQTTAELGLREVGAGYFYGKYQELSLTLTYRNEINISHDQTELVSALLTSSTEGISYTAGRGHWREHHWGTVSPMERKLPVNGLIFAASFPTARPEKYTQWLRLRNFVSYYTCEGPSVESISSKPFEVDEKFIDQFIQQPSFWRRKNHASCRRAWAQYAYTESLCPGSSAVWKEIVFEQSTNKLLSLFDGQAFIRSPWKRSHFNVLLRRDPKSHNYEIYATFTIAMVSEKDPDTKFIPPISKLLSIVHPEQDKPSKETDPEMRCFPELNESALSIAFLQNVKGGRDYLRSKKISMNSCKTVHEVLTGNISKKHGWTREQIVTPKYLVTRFAQDSRSISTYITTIISNFEASAINVTVMELQTWNYDTLFRTYYLYEKKKNVLDLETVDYFCSEEDKFPMSYTSATGKTGKCSMDLYGSIIWSTEVPPNSNLTTQFEAHKRFLHRDDYDADASRGVQVPPVFLIIEGEGFFVTPSRLITMPIPDFSMPYNVIMICSTLVAFLIGSMTNALWRRRRYSRDQIHNKLQFIK